MGTVVGILRSHYDFTPKDKAWVHLGTCYGLLRTDSTHLQVDDRHSPPVSTAHNTVEVLQPRGQEGTEGASQPHGSGLLEALEVSPTDATHAT